MNKKKCIICNQASLKLDTIANKILGLNDKFNVYKCKNCNQCLLLPQLNYDELNKLYSSAYFDNSTSLNFDQHNDISKASDDYKNIISSRLLKFRSTINLLKIINPKGNLILDVGAATGEFLNEAKKMNLQIEGIEFSEFAIEQALANYNIKIEKLQLSEISSEKKYDFIHLNHVFEHFNDPNEEVKNLYSLLDENGVLYIEIPFQFHFIERILYKYFKNKPQFSLSSVHHPFFYTPQTIRSILEYHNFNVISIKVFDRSRYQALTLFSKIKFILWLVLSYFKIGNFIEIIAIKKIKSL